MAVLGLREFLSLAETKPANEFACGEVTQKPMPDGPHAAIQMFLAAMLFQHLSTDRRGRAFTELRCIFGPSQKLAFFVRMARS